MFIPNIIDSHTCSTIHPPHFSLCATPNVQQHFLIFTWIFRVFSRTSPSPSPLPPQPQLPGCSGARLLLAQLQRSAVDLDHRRVDAAGAAGPDACLAQPGGEPWRGSVGMSPAAPETVCRNSGNCVLCL